MGHGAVAGLESSGRDEVTKLATGLAARVLSGERPDDIPVVHASGQQVLADARQLRHWHIPESSLPAGTFFYNREPTLWERERKYFISAIVLFLAQAILIAGLLWQRARKRRAEAVLRESEERFRVMADTAPSLIWMCDERGNVIYLNDRWTEFTGADPAVGTGDSWTEHVHPDDLKNLSDTFSHAVVTRQPFSLEYRLRRRDGTYRWMFNVASPRVNGDASFSGFIGSAIDTTDQKLAQSALERVSGQLIEAQEKERSRIARDLHDDICQRLVLLSMELEQINRGSTGSAAATKDSLEEIRKHCAEIAGDVQSLSHQLHSSKLDYLGLAAAVKGFCAEFSKQHTVVVDFTEASVPKSLAKDVSLCLFRVAQEALHNAVKYSETDHFTVELTGMSDAIQLIVSDEGKGFEVEKAKRGRGLGLVSMQERVHLVNGTLLIESTPGRGTKVLAVVPFVAESGVTEDSSSEAGWVDEADERFAQPLSHRARR